jgi:hypothetical protein
MGLAGQAQGARRRRCGDIGDDERRRDCIGRMLGLTPGDIALMKYKAELSRMAAKAIRESELN